MLHKSKICSHSDTEADQPQKYIYLGPHQFDLYGGNGWLSTMEFDEEANRIYFRCYSPWVEKKMKILSGEIENNGILLPGEMRLFPFDKLCNTVVATDNMVIEIDFKKRFTTGQ